MVVVRDVVQWMKSRKGFLSIGEKIAYVSSSVADHLTDAQSVINVQIGFSEDRGKLYMRKSDIGIKLSLVNKKSNRRTFATRSDERVRGRNNSRLNPTLCVGDRNRKYR